MQSPSSAEIANAIVQSALLSNWQFWLLWLVLTATGSAIGVWINERIKGDVSKNVFLAQESWKEKYRLYTILIKSAEEIAGALWHIHTDTRVLKLMGNSDPSTEADGLSNFPEHQRYLEIEQHANQQLLSAEVGVELMLSEDARKAFEIIKEANTTTKYATNMSYYDRIKFRVDAASRAKSAYIDAARLDLRV